MVGTRFFDTLCKRVLPLNLSNNKKIKKLELAGLIRDHRYIVNAIIYLMHLLYANLYFIPFVYILFNAL